MGGIRKIDTLLAFRRNRDGADRRVEAALLQTAENRFHVGNRDQLELPLHPFGDPAPEVDADARNRTVGVHISVRWDVIDRDPQRSGLVLLRAIGANRRRQATAEAERGDHEDLLVKRRHMTKIALYHEIVMSSRIPTGLRP